MKGFSVDSTSKKGNVVPPKDPPVFVPLDVRKPQFQHLSGTGREIVTLTSKVEPVSRFPR